MDCSQQGCCCRLLNAGFTNHGLGLTNSVQATKVLSSFNFTQHYSHLFALFCSFMDGNAGSSSPQSSLKRNRLIQMLNDSRITQFLGYRRVQEAYDLLKTDSSVKEIVVSISSDKAVWEAVLGNKAVQDLRDSLIKGIAARISGEESDWAALILKWILRRAMSIFGDLIARFGMLIGQTFQGTELANTSSEVIKSLNGTIESLFLLSVVILIIVVVNRGREVTPAT